HTIESFNLNIFECYDFHFSIDLMNLYILLFLFVLIQVEYIIKNR
ncbi:hypothetical protein ECA0157_17306, partial [Escherichia coli ECA-0157]